MKRIDYTVEVETITNGVGIPIKVVGAVVKTTTERKGQATIATAKVVDSFVLRLEVSE